MPTDPDKETVWSSYFERSPSRVPMRLNTNPRVVLQDPEWNPDGITFEDAARDPETHIEIALRHELYRRQVLGPRSDLPTELPEEWAINYWWYNVSEAATLGAEIVYLPGQLPDTRPFLDESNKRAIFDLPIEKPLEFPFIRDGLAFWHEMDRICRDRRFEGRPVRLVPWELIFTDGPLTVACNVRGGDILAELVTDPEYAQELLAFLTRASILRRESIWRYFGDRLPQANGMADDSCALISPKMYRECLMPHHRAWYDAGPAGSVRTMHLCGDATRHFGAIHSELGVTSFDTGFPIDFAAMRDELGPDVELTGGVEVALLLEGTPDQVFERARTILESGVKEGGRFVLQEGNNLPPFVPLENLDAMYKACLAFGGHETG
jgi:hypothetical protein